MLTRGNWRQPLLIIIICTMLTGLVFSRAVLSITSAAFMALLLSEGPFKNRILVLFKTPILIIITALFLIPFISVLWSHNKESWLQLITTKLPLFFLPLAFAQGFRLSQKQWSTVALFFLLTVFIATLYSTALYITNASFYEAAYKRAKVLATPMHGDHLRFSLLVSIAILLLFFLIQKTSSRLNKWLLIFFTVWFFIYLHLLAARTGLICAYLIITSVAVRYIFFKKKVVLGTALFLSVIFLAMFAWAAMPTFKARLLYLRYDITQVYHGHYVPGTTDGSRVLSLRGGWQLLKEAPLGVGLGDIKAEMSSWYDKAVPAITASDKLFPSSEWLLHGLMAGWAGLVLFSIAVIAPFFLQIHYRFWWCLLNAVLLLSITFDTGLSTQFGVFMHAFFILMWWQFSSTPRNTENVA